MTSFPATLLFLLTVAVAALFATTRSTRAGDETPSCAEVAGGSGDENGLLTSREGNARGPPHPEDADVVAREDGSRSCHGELTLQDGEQRIVEKGDIRARRYGRRQLCRRESR